MSMERQLEQSEIDETVIFNSLIGEAYRRFKEGEVFSDNFDEPKSILAIAEDIAK